MHFNLGKFLLPSKIHLFFAFLLIVSISGCDSSGAVAVTEVSVDERLSDSELQSYENKINQIDHDHIHFGFDLRSSPQEDLAQYLPLMNYLTQETGYKFKLAITPKNSSILNELKQNNIQLAAMGAVNVIRAEEAGLASILVQGLNHQNKATYQSMFIVPIESKIYSIQDIKGKSLAFGDKNSTQGHLIPRIVLQKYNIKLSDLNKFDYFGSHQRCAEAVVSGDYEVCALQDQLAKDLAKRGLIRIIYASQDYPSSGIVFSHQLPIEMVQKIQNALLKFKPNGKHKKGLYNWNKTEMPNGFVEPDKNSYRELREWLIKLELLN